MNFSRWWLALVVATLLGAGCTRTPEQLDGEDEKNPHLMEGTRKKTGKDFRGAAAAFERALEVQPNNALAHFEIARLQDADGIKTDDLPAAIYHYQRFIALRPQSQKVELVRGFIRDDLMRLMASVPHSNVLPPQEIARLQGENDALRRENEELRARLESSGQGGSLAPGVARTASVNPTAGSPVVQAPAPRMIATTTVPVVTAVRPAPAASASPPAASGRKYVVQKGDTLSTIAKRFLGNSAAAEKIFAANRGVLKDRNKLIVGQTLVIPAH